MSIEIESVKLKPCPSCGGDLASVRYHNFGCHHIECDNCHIQTAEYGGSQSASIWNSQPAIERLKQENAELRKVLEFCIENSEPHSLADFSEAKELLSKLNQEGEE